MRIIQKNSHKSTTVVAIHNNSARHPCDTRFSAPLPIWLAEIVASEEGVKK